MNTHIFTVTILTALLAVFMLASSAWAECAWVLWSSLSGVDPVDTTKVSEKDVVWRIHRALASEDKCVQEQTALLGRWRAETKQDLRLGELTLSSHFSEPDGRLTLFHEPSGKVVRAQAERALCLPDTVDPRGPKASGR